jgi:peptide/nickel transport system permease protein
MFKFLVRRLLQMIATLWGVTTVLFFMFRFMPGDPTAFMLSPQMTRETKQRIIERWGLNEPLWQQYIGYIQNVARLDFGQSFHSQQPVTDIIITFLPNTLILMFVALILGYVFGISLGILAGWYRGTRFENNIVISALLSQSIPSFWIAVLVLWIFSFELNIIPATGVSSIGVEQTALIDLYLSWDFWRHLIAPASVLGFAYLGYPLLIMRNSMLEVLAEDFIKMCKAKGLSEREIMFKHAARNSFLPVLTVVAINIGYAVAGSVLIETVFGWPGIGRKMVNAVLFRDYPVAQGLFMMLAGVVIIMNFVADIAYGYLDPRVRYD